MQQTKVAAVLEGDGKVRLEIESLKMRLKKRKGSEGSEDPDWGVLSVRVSNSKGSITHWAEL